jgi:protein-tyrosine phosphatase
VKLGESAAVSEYLLLDERLPPDLNWIEPGFALGGRPYAAQRPAVRELGIQTIVTVHTPLPDEVATWTELGLETFVLPTRDYVAIPFERFEAVTSTVLASLAAARSVLLHCLSGVNRAPTFALAVLCRRDGLSVEEALGRLRVIRPRVAPTMEELDSLRSWLARSSS